MQQHESVALAAIGGSGLYNLPELTDRTSYQLDTPYGPPSDEIIVGTLHGKRIAFLPRHGRGHVFTPSTVPYRANIYALKLLGVRHIIAVNACGSLREDYAPGHIVMPDQLVDMTKHDRGRTFFDTGIVGHVSMPDPLTPQLGQHLYQTAQGLGITAHYGGSFVIIEGPRFSTRGESHIFRQWGCSVIGMTTCPEAFLAAEAEMSYATMAHITDYDVWHTHAVTVEEVVRVAQQNISAVGRILSAAVAAFDPSVSYPCHSGLQNAIMTAPNAISDDMRTKLAPLVGKYIG
jgi:5'-methylthioadenosine phosphorylase